MYRQIVLIFIAVIQILSLSAKTFNQWYIDCAQLPFYRNIGSTYKYTSLKLHELEEVCQKFIGESKNSKLADATAWLEFAPKQDDQFFVSQKPLKLIKPFVEKIVVPNNSVVAFHGDLHGDVHSLLAYIKSLQDKNYLKKNSFKIKDPNFYMIFLGDYTDRGNYGAEVVYTIMRLKIANPQKVFLVRGNHEDIQLNLDYGFAQEIFEKFDLDANKLTASLNAITRIYDFMPVAIYLGTKSEDNSYDFIQSCHGGMEIGFNPKKLFEADEKIKFQLLGELHQKQEANCCCFDISKTKGYKNLSDFYPTDYFSIGFMWNDFYVDQSQIFGYKSGRGFEYGKKITNWLLEHSSSVTHKLRAVFRGHQHSAQLTPMMESILIKDDKDQANLGISKIWNTDSIFSNTLWQGLVCTFLVSPDSSYGIANGSYPGYNFDAYGILHLADKFENWQLQVARNKIV